MQQQRAQTTGRTREIDVTPIGWMPPTGQEMVAILEVIASYFGREWVGYAVRVDRLLVELQELDGVPVMERVRQARIRIGALRQQQQLALWHESDSYERVRAHTLAAAQRAMIAVRSQFTLEHPKEVPMVEQASASNPMRAAIAAAKATSSYGPQCACGHAVSAHFGKCERFSEEVRPDANAG